MHTSLFAFYLSDHSRLGFFMHLSPSSKPLNVFPCKNSSTPMSTSYSPKSVLQLLSLFRTSDPLIQLTTTQAPHTQHVENLIHHLLSLPPPHNPFLFPFSILSMAPPFIIAQIRDPGVILYSAPLQPSSRTSNQCQGL